MVDFGFGLVPSSRINLDLFDKASYEELASMEPDVRKCMSCGSCTAVCTAGKYSATSLREAIECIHNGQPDKALGMLKSCQFCGCAGSHRQDPFRVQPFRHTFLHRHSILPDMDYGRLHPVVAEDSSSRQAAVLGIPRESGYGIEEHQGFVLRLPFPCQDLEAEASAGIYAQRNRFRMVHADRARTYRSSPVRP